MTNLDERFAILKSRLQEELKGAENILQEATRRYDEAAECIAIVDQALEMAGAVDMDSRDEPPPDESETPVETIDFSGAKNLQERCERIAFHNGGRIHARTAARQLIAASVQGGNVNNLASSIYRLLDGLDDWIRESPGVYLWLRVAGESLTNDLQRTLSRAVGIH